MPFGRVLIGHSWPFPPASYNRSESSMFNVSCLSSAKSRGWSCVLVSKENATTPQLLALGADSGSQQIGNWSERFRKSTGSSQFLPSSLHPKNVVGSALVNAWWPRTNCDVAAAICRWGLCSSISVFMQILPSEQPVTAINSSAHRVEDAGQ